VADLIRFQVAQLRRLGKNEATMAAIRRLIKLERDDPSSLAELVDWLVKQKAWKEVDELEQQFASQFTANPLLLYLLAQAYAEQGQKDRAEETAGRAFKLYPDKQDDHLKRHLIVADALLQWGQFAWARREYEYAIELSNPADHFVLLERIKLAEMLHDQGEDLDAAKVLERLGEIVKQHRNQIPGEISGKGWEEKQSRMHFFRACHWEKQNDLAKRRESLDKALENYDEDVDVLIACYRLPNQPAEYHAKILGLIKKAANSLRDQIAQDPQDSGPYNEFAWLIGNTEGDFDEALKFSQKSLELLPETGGYYDTLARVYFAKGDLDNAIKNQMKATELDPHSQQIRRQLKFFQEAADEKKGKKS
jgi:tetratricopeptide (TPR) repeat protein